MADGIIVDVSAVDDPVFAHEALGRTIAFRFAGAQVTLCSPVAGKLSAVFPTGEAFSMRTDEGLELLVHIDVHTGAAEGRGFALYHRNPGCTLRPGDEIVNIPFARLSKTYDMTTMLIITNAEDLSFSFLREGSVKKGQSVIAP